MYGGAQRQRKPGKDLFNETFGALAEAKTQSKERLYKQVERRARKFEVRDL